MWFQKSETLHASAPLSPGERHVLHRLRCQVIRTCPFGRPDDLVARITRLLGDQPCLALVPGEAWSDTVNAELATLPTASRERWIELLKHAASSTGSRPSSSGWSTRGRQTRQTPPNEGLWATIWTLLYMLWDRGPETGETHSQVRARETNPSPVSMLHSCTTTCRRSCATASINCFQPMPAQIGRQASLSRRLEAGKLEAFANQLSIATRRSRLVIRISTTRLI